MEKEKYQQLSSEEIKKFEEENMTKKQERQSDSRGNGFDLLGSKETMESKINAPISKEEHAEILFKRLLSSLDVIRKEYGHGDKNATGRADYLTHIETIKNRSHNKGYDPDAFDSFRPAFIHEFFGLAKEYVYNTDLSAKDKIIVIDEFTEKLVSEFYDRGRGSEAKAHVPEIIKYIQQIKEEVKDALQSESEK